MSHAHRTNDPHRASPRWLTALAGVAFATLGVAGVGHAAEPVCGLERDGVSCGASGPLRLAADRSSGSLGLGLRSGEESAWRTELLLEFDPAVPREPDLLSRPSDSRLALAGRRGGWRAGVGGFLDFGSLTGLSRSGVNPYLGVGWSAVLHEEAGDYQYSPYADRRTRVDSGEFGSVLTATVGADITLSDEQTIDFGLHYSEYTDSRDLSLRRLRSSFGPGSGVDAWGMRLGFTHRFGR